MSSAPQLVEQKLDVQKMHTSEAGLNFIFRHEALKGVTEHLHWPKGSSGVTLGAGYDMKERTATQIANDLKSIGIPSAAADKASKAAGLKHDKAEDFAGDNKALLSLTQQQQVDLLRKIVPHYEAIVKRNVRSKLSQQEFDALVSFAYNPGGSIHPVAHALDTDKQEDAMNIILSRIVTGHKKSEGLKNRRQDEVNLFLHGAYESHHPVPHKSHHHIPGAIKPPVPVK